MHRVAEELYFIYNFSRLQIDGYTVLLLLLIMSFYRWFGIQLNPQFIGMDLKFFFVRAGMMGWLLINLSVLAKCIQEGILSRSMIFYQLFCFLYILDYFFHEEYMTST
ncbi:delta(14)-sterol reductase-like [Olea europaea var. sylvestris]|uniref:delta(14)-sterol reductase-like n=1 Tax=Olea europaea var. sylvestris TaxID=158386 RepID=UPI000C1D62EB|nr:delta(14)-sterol reductase-like [Olea europaea var. sylvestris]